MMFDHQTLWLGALIVGQCCLVDDLSYRYVCCYLLMS